MKPIIETEALISYHQQVKKIAYLASVYCDDLLGVLPNNFEAFYNSVCRIPYKEDSYREEINARPKWIMKMDSIDCKKKSTLIASYCILHKIPVRFVVMSSRRDRMPHHIYTEVKKGKTWIPADATYAGNKLGKREPETFREVFEYE